MTDFLELYKIHYREFFSRMSDGCLIRQEELVSRLIDADFSSELIQLDEILALYEIIRDECVRRVSFMAHSPK